ncbi:MAG TPA: leishmanolysin-related zinc metalloendopeptidase [Gemmatimonadaceae bacterium]|nr:leishmanolysin-related zinc metalloendopeptidase [Gemmatimonadaceae bacterium]
MTKLAISARAFTVAAAALLGLAAACSDSSVAPPVATTLTLSASAISLDAIGATQTVTAVVNDQHGQPMATAPITWTASAANVLVTGTAGTATIAAAANGTATVTATSGKATATITVTVAQIPTALQKLGGDAQLGAVNTTLVQPVGVRVVDRLNSPVANQGVTFTIASGGGSVASTTVTTGNDGVAATTWTLGKIASSTQQLTVVAGSLAPLTYSATAVAGAPANVLVAGGDKQSAVAGAALATAPQVLVTDAFTNPVSNATVTFTPVGDGSIQFPTATTNASGIAFAGRWTLGTTVGTKSLIASVGAVSVTFTASATGGAPSSVKINAGNNQTAAAGSAVATAPSVKVTDALGNAAAGAVVTFAVASGGGSVTGGTTTTDASGVATVGRWTLGSAAGTNTLTATVANVSPVTFTATATSTTPAAVSALFVSAGANQAATAGTAVPNAPSIVARDAAGNPVSGVTITFTASDGGTIGGSTSATVKTNTSGVAAPGAWILASTATLNTLTASTPGVSAVQLNAAACEPPNAAGFTITLCYRTSMTASQRAAFVNAAARWRSIITAKLPDVPVNISEGACDTGTPSLTNMTIDDVMIFAGIEPIDGAGSILGSAGWCFRRTGGLPVLGNMSFDVADMATLEANGTLNAVILHEMGHVLGIGTMWTTLGLLQNQSTSSVVNDTYFSGTAAVAAFNQVGGATYTLGQKVPVENTGGSGTINAHWRESVLRNELMTGFLNSGTNPLSVVTIGSLQDLGYSVNMAAADPLSLTLSIQSTLAPGAATVSVMNDGFRGKQSTIDSFGRVTRIR